MARRSENIYKRKDGRYEGRYIKYYDVSGKAVFVSFFKKKVGGRCETDNAHLR